MSDPQSRQAAALAAVDRQIEYLRAATPTPWHIGDAVDPTTPCNIHSATDARGVADNVRWLDAELTHASLVLRGLTREGRVEVRQRRGVSPGDSVEVRRVTS